ncbi:regulatory protein RecX [Robiginitalea sp. IMCC43444]|uniref:regulatory protein RecX n=1 Tax=Robiginitalea sp. IMCC43444 TaxID=3459121 RepID=UPI00404279CA
MNRFGNKSYTLEEATRRLERYCAYQERCHQEVVQKLKELGMIPKAIDKIVVHLIGEGFLNEHRFAMAFTRGKFNQKNWGRDRIERELQLRDISPYLIAKALQEIPEKTYLLAFEELASKKLKSLRGKPKEEQKRKLFNFLLYRGWEKDLIYDRLRKIK